MQINFINDRNQDILLLLCSFVYFTLSFDFKHITCICFYTCHHNFMTEILPERLKSKLINKSYNCIPCQMFTSLFLSTDHSLYLRLHLAAAFNSDESVRLYIQNIHAVLYTKQLFIFILYNYVTSI